MAVTIVLVCVICVVGIGIILGILYIKKLEKRISSAENTVNIFRGLLNEMRGEEEVRRILGEVAELKEKQEAIEPHRYEISTITALQEHLELFKSGSTCLFAADEGLKIPVFYIVHLHNRLGDVELTRDIVHIRFKPSKPEQVRSVVTKHLPETAAKLYLGKKVQDAKDRKLDFVMPTAGMVESYSGSSSDAFLSQLKLA